MIKLQLEDFDLACELKKLTERQKDTGALCSFVGLVRDMSTGTKQADFIKSMTLEHYPGMTEKALSEIEAKAHKRWPLKNTLIIHRYGHLLPGDRIVLVAVSSAHREAAFEACRFLIDWLKVKAPFWKLEETNRGKNWVKAKSSDEKAAIKWDK